MTASGTGTQSGGAQAGGAQTKGAQTMPQTLAQKLVAKAAGRAHVATGEIVTCKVDLAMFHDSSGPRRLQPMLERLGAKVWDTDKVVLITDHYVPEYDADSRKILQITRDWAKAQHIKNFYDTQAWIPKNAVLLNKKAFEALDKPTQDALLKAAAEAETRGWKISEEKNDFYKKALAEKGMKIMVPPAKLTADLKQVGSTMLDDWLKKAGPDGKALVDAFNKK